MIIKQVFRLLTLTLMLSSCNKKLERTIVAKDVSDKTAANIKFHKLKKLFVVGDFDGDGSNDTILQHNFSRFRKAEIDNSPDPFQNDWEIVEKWFYEQDPDVNLTIKKHSDTLHLGLAQGLYCLINIGDNNSDGKDEIAFVLDYLDYSRVNSCKIYSLCKDKWVLLKQFDIHEDAFNFDIDKGYPNFNCIKDYLEIKKGKWFYKDYSQTSYERKEEAGKMQKLKLDICK